MSTPSHTAALVAGSVAVGAAATYALLRNRTSSATAVAAVAAAAAAAAPPASKCPRGGKVTPGGSRSGLVTVSSARCSLLSTTLFLTFSLCHIYRCQVWRIRI